LSFEQKALRASLPLIVGGVVALSSIVALGALIASPGEVSIARYATSLDGRNRAQRHNADLALSRLNGAVIKPGETFSFNKRVGTFSRDQGYRKAPVSYNGQLVDSWGGGVCQTSTTLYNTALLAGMTIVERSRHRFCPSYVPPGRDAAVAFNTIDLKFRNPYSFPVRIQAVDRSDRVEVEMLADHALADRPQVVSQIAQVHDPTVFLIGDRDGYGRLRNSGKPGYEVNVFRYMGKQKELVSSDNYPAMNRIVQTR
jgi:vancomycin resistance protein VanW